MRTLIYTAFVSLDGVVQGPGPEPGYPNCGQRLELVESASCTNGVQRLCYNVGR